ncbi:MAG: hypothetical protein NZM37_09435 [Sandaracinaceae bacterium]|nr:hypothetical protein [Sandaracinaceae bacterium]
MFSRIREKKGCVVLALGGLALTGCAPKKVALEVAFPSAETFLVTQAIRVRVFVPNQTSTCAALVNDAIGGRMPMEQLVYDINDLTPCSVRSGAKIPDPGGGRKLFLVEGLDMMRNTTLLIGCSEGEIHGKSTAIRVRLYPTQNYDRAYRQNPPQPEETPETRCMRRGV